VTYGVGAAAAIVGAALLYVNRLQPYRIQIGVGGVKAWASLLPTLGGGVFTVDF
jgi:hypothetical protein